MGYNSWYDLMCSPYMNETTLHATADAMVEKGLVKLGYNYLNLDDCELPAISPRCSPTPHREPDPRTGALSTGQPGVRVAADHHGEPEARLDPPASRGRHRRCAPLSSSRLLPFPGSSHSGLSAVPELYLVSAL